jgi:hypothetical protein
MRRHQRAARKLAGGAEPSGATGTFVSMCRNITMLRGLEPAASGEEIEAAARQYVRKVSGVQSVTPRTQAPFERAVSLVAEATRELLAGLPPRPQPPPTLPPLRRPGVQERERARQARAAAATR